MKQATPPPSNGSVVARGEIGNALEISVQKILIDNLKMEMNAFETKIIVSIFRYQSFLTFAISC